MQNAQFFAIFLCRFNGEYYEKIGRTLETLLQFTKGNEMITLPSPAFLSPAKSLILYYFILNSDRPIPSAEVASKTGFTQRFVRKTVKDFQSDFVETCGYKWLQIVSGYKWSREGAIIRFDSVQMIKDLKSQNLCEIDALILSQILMLPPKNQRNTRGCCRIILIAKQATSAIPLERKALQIFL